MNKAIIPILIFGGAVYVYAQRKLKAVGKLKISPENISFTGKFPNYKMIIDLLITNPTPTQLSVDNIFADVIVNGTEVGKVILNEKFFIEPKKENIIKVPVVIKLGTAIATMITLLREKKPVKVLLVGTISSEGFDIELNEEIPLSV
jgi:LEA14-like dessication related protein